MYVCLLWIHNWNIPMFSDSGPLLTFCISFDLFGMMKFEVREQLVFKAFLCESEPVLEVSHSSQSGSQVWSNPPLPSSIALNQWERTGLSMFL